MSLFASKINKQGLFGYNLSRLQQRWDARVPGSGIDLTSDPLARFLEQLSLSTATYPTGDSELMKKIFKLHSAQAIRSKISAGNFPQDDAAINNLLALVDTVEPQCDGNAYFSLSV